MEEQGFVSDVNNDVNNAAEVQGSDSDTLTPEQDEQMNLYRRNKKLSVTPTKFARFVQTTLGRVRRAL
jgi:phage terminase Nu1 subunit (DNA packaging protein)